MRDARELLRDILEAIAAVERHMHRGKTRSGCVPVSLSWPGCIFDEIQKPPFIQSLAE